MTTEFNSEWFLAAQTNEAKFIVTQGISQVTFDSNKFFAEFYFAEDSNLYLTISGSISTEGEIKGVATSAQADVPEFDLNGYIFDDGQTTSVVLTDGWTTVGISCNRDRSRGPS